MRREISQQPTVILFLWNQYFNDAGHYPRQNTPISAVKSGFAATATS